jgi:hypothetical protein
LLVIVGVIVVLVVPSFALLFRLAGSGRLAEGERPPLGSSGLGSSGLSLSGLPRGAAGQRYTWPAAVIVAAMVTRELMRRLRAPK